MTIHILSGSSVWDHNMLSHRSHEEHRQRVRALPDLATALTIVTTALTSIHPKSILKILQGMEELTSIAPLVSTPIVILSGQDGKDAKSYQERDVQQLLAEIQRRAHR